MTVTLALATALLYGSGDFLGGLAARRSPAVAVVFWSQVVGSAVLVAVLPFLPGRPTGEAIAWGLAAGAAGGAGMVFLYRGLAAGPIAVVAPVTAVFAAVVPVLGGTLLGERLGGGALAGVAVGLAAVVLLSIAPPGVPDPQVQGPGRRHRWAAAVTGVAAGTSFGLFFLALDRTDADAGLWPLLGARATSLTLVAVVGLLWSGLRLAAEGRRLAPAAGVLDMGANVTFLLATRLGQVGVVAVIVAFAPAATVGLARLVLHERIHRAQAAGFVAAGVAVVLIAVG